MNNFGYRSIWYDARKKHIHLWTWDDNGNRIENIVPFNPYLYIETTSKSDGVSIYGTNLKKISFPSQFERRRYVKDCGIKRLFFNHKPEQQYLLETYLGLNDNPDFTSQPIKIFYLDIEVCSPNEFPTANEAKFPIDLITVYDSLNSEYRSFGLQPYAPKLNNVKYCHCRNEIELLQNFLNYWCSDYPEVMTGWNSDGFDTPYIINRITKLLGEDEAKRLSPVNSIYYKEDIAQKYGKSVGRWVIHGINCIDYKEIYETFSREKRESYSLDYISKVELGEGKLAYNATTLAKLSSQNWDTYVDYNIKDVELLTRLETKLRFLKIMRMISYKGFCNISDTLGKVTVVTGVVSAQSLKRGMILSTFENEDMGNYAGGFIKDIEPGLWEWIVTFDANSLYPNALITLNLSPETKVGKIVSIDDDNVNLLLVNGKNHTISKEQFLKFVNSEKIAISKAKILFSQKTKGIVPEYVDGLYAERVSIKTEMNEIERSLIHCKKDSLKYKENVNKKEQLDLLQFTIKILLNSIYGVFANRHGPLYDIDCASSITLTGQSVIKQAGIIIDKYAKDRYGIAQSITHYGDTDSAHISIKPIIDAINLTPTTPDGLISSELYTIVNDINTQLNTGITEWARESLNSIDPRFFFKREAICSAGLYQSKKHYILHIKDKGEDKPLPCDKIKPVGVELVKSTVSSAIKGMMMDVVKSLLGSRDRLTTLNTYKRVYEDFKALPPEEVAFRSSVKTLDKYASQSNGFNLAKRTHIAVAGAINHNQLLKELGLTGKYDAISADIRIKWVYCIPNKYKIRNLAFINTIPSEFNDIVPDYELMFKKIMQPAIERLFECAHWKFVDLQSEYTVDLLDLFAI